MIIDRKLMPQAPADVVQRQPARPASSTSMASSTAPDSTRTTQNQWRRLYAPPAMAKRVQNEMRRKRTNHKA